MPLLTLTRAAASRQRVTLTDDAGSILEAYEANLMLPRAQAKLSARTGLPPAQLAAAVASVTPKGSTPVEVPFTEPTGAPAAGPFGITIRGMHQPLDTGTTVEASAPAEALKLALAVTDFPAAEPVMQWDDLDQLCCLDIDYHALPFDSRPGEDLLRTRAAVINPRPVAVHTSHGRGCKLYYVALPGFTARELAAVGALAWLAQDRRATADLVKISRHPAYTRPTAAGPLSCGPVSLQTPGDDLQPVAVWLQRTADPEAVEEWLEERGWKRHDKRPHEECLICPSPSHGTPVYVGGDGVFCHKCHSAGASLGRTPGFTPWAALVGGAPPRAAVMIRNAVHWTHAKHILRHETRLPDGILNAAYTAAVKLHHGSDSPAAAAVSAAGRDIIRMDGRWVTPDGSTPFSQNQHGLLNALPAVWLPGTREVLAERRDMFLQAADLSHYGYYPVTPVHGAAVYGRHLEYPDDRVAFAVPARQFRETNPPTYRKPAERMAADDAWKILEQTFPGLNRNYVKLLIALKGLAEGGNSQAPFCIVTGPTASAKSSTVHIAASICGDTATEPTFNASNERLMQAIAGGLDKGSFVVLNEIFKEAQRAKLKPRAALDPILTLTPNAHSHRLYIGPRPLGRLPALVLTDITIPDAILSDQQLARRLVLVQQTQRVDWADTIAKAGFGEIGRYRLSSTDAAIACDAILSDVIDAFFRWPRTVADIAGELGFQVLEESDAAAHGRKTLRDFFDAVCAAPDLTGSDKQRYGAPGWKVIRRGDSSAAADLWEEIADGLQGDEWGASRQATAEDWGKLMGVPGRLLFQSAARRGAVYVRFTLHDAGGSVAAATWDSRYGAKLPVDAVKVV